MLSAFHREWETTDRLLRRSRDSASRFYTPFSQTLVLTMVYSCWDTDSMELAWQITPRACSMYVSGALCEYLLIYHYSASSAVSPDEKVVVVANLYDGLDWYKISDRAFSRSVPLRISHNVPIPVLLVDGGNILLVGGTSGNAKILDAHTAETIQILDHNRTKLLTVRSHSKALIEIPIL